MNNNSRYAVSFLTLDQLKAFESLSREFKPPVIRVYVSSDLVLDDEYSLNLCKTIAQKSPQTEWILMLPEILRSKEETYLQAVDQLLEKKDPFTGVLTGSIEGIGYYAGKNIKLYGDHNLYLWNSHAIHAMSSMLSGGCLPLELNVTEQKDLLQLSFPWDKIVYGHIPMMITANCVAKTTDQCQKAYHGEHSFYLQDRMNKSFPVRLVCRHCFNVIYNCLPLSLHKELGKYQEKSCLRLQFTLEDHKLTEEILRFFLMSDPKESKPPYAEYTTGHEKRGVL